MDVHIFNGIRAVMSSNCLLQPEPFYFSGSDGADSPEPEQDKGEDDEDGAHRRDQGVAEQGRPGRAQHL